MMDPGATVHAGGPSTGADGAQTVLPAPEETAAPELLELEDAAAPELVPPPELELELAPPFPDPLPDPLPPALLELAAPPP